MRCVDKGGGGQVFFTYDASGQRVRKVWEHGVVEERIYLGGFEIYRKRLTLGGAVDLERETFHVMDDQRRVAMVETKTREGGAALAPPVTRWRFQLDNHLGSATLELDQAGNVIGYEEYHPYGSTAFSATSASSEVSAKRYRYTGKERDEETGLYYHGARYYAPWLGRWTAADPLGLAQPGRADLNLWAYVRGQPMRTVDPTGLEDQPAAPKLTRAQRLKNLEAIGIKIDDPTKAQEFTYMNGKREVKGYYVPGKGEDVALIYGGIHGDERRGKVIASRTIEALSKPGAEAPEIGAIIIPDVFGREPGGPENSERFKGKKKNGEDIDPNREFVVEKKADKSGPAASGSIVDTATNKKGQRVDGQGNPILPTSAQVQEIREALQPERILQLHGVRGDYQGVYTDPRLGHEAEDRLLTVAIGSSARSKGAKTPGNTFSEINREHETVYPLQSKVAPDPGRGSAGTAFSHTVTRKDGTVIPAANVVLIETTHDRLPAQGKPDKEIDAYVHSIITLFLRNF